jgi:hypothetical protein
MLPHFCSIDKVEAKYTYNFVSKSLPFAGTSMKRLYYEPRRFCQSLHIEEKLGITLQNKLVFNNLHDVLYDFTKEIQKILY